MAVSRNSPRVSVVIPTYNRAAFLPGAIASVQGQTVADWELIVVDDASKDDTRVLIERVARADPRIRGIVNDHAPGPAGARNAGIARARADFVAFLDSDDLWSPDHLEQLLTRLAPEPDLGLAATDHRMVDRQAGTSGTAREFLMQTMLPWWETMPLARAVIPCARMRADIAAIAEPAAILGETIGGFLWIQTSAVMVRRPVLQSAGPFDEMLRRTEDIDLWLRISRRWPIGFVDRPSVFYDVTGRRDASGPRYENQAAERRHSAYGERLHHARLLGRIARLPDLTRAQRAFLRDRRGAIHRRAAQLAGGGRRGAAAWHCALSLWHRPAGMADFARAPRAFFREPA